MKSPSGSEFERNWKAASGAPSVSLMMVSVPCLTLVNVQVTSSPGCRVNSTTLLFTVSVVPEQVMSARVQPAGNWLTDSVAMTARPVLESGTATATGPMDAEPPVPVVSSEKLSSGEGRSDEKKNSSSPPSVILVNVTEAGALLTKVHVTASPASMVTSLTAIRSKLSWTVPIGLPGSSSYSHCALSIRQPASTWAGLSPSPMEKVWPRSDVIWKVVCAVPPAVSRVKPVGV